MADEGSELSKWIRAFIEDQVANAQTQTAYRQPVVGFAKADDTLFPTLKTVCGSQHLVPSDLLAEARSVVAFFIPFTGELVRLNAQHPFVAREWAVAYAETNRLIAAICERLSAALEPKGVRAAWTPPTYQYDRDSLVANWSHKHIAYVAGLGTFGVHHMLITERGCAGRLGSLVIDARLPASDRRTRPCCRHYRGEQCLVCVRRCPVEALDSTGFARLRCYARLLTVDAHFEDLESVDVCGKCATGPCSTATPGPISAASPDTDPLTDPSQPRGF